MQTATRHGGGSHYVRPDRVYRTSVLSPTNAYEPEMDVHAIAEEFTSRPMDLPVNGNLGAARGYSLLGRNGYQLLGPGLFQRLGMRWRAWKSRTAYKRALAHRIASGGMRGLRGFGEVPDPTAGMAYVQQARQLAPDMVGRAAMAQQLVSFGLPDGVASAQAATSAEHFWNQRWRG